MPGGFIVCRLLYSLNVPAILSVGSLGVRFIAYFGVEMGFGAMSFDLSFGHRIDVQSTNELRKTLGLGIDVDCGSYTS